MTRPSQAETSANALDACPSFQKVYEGDENHHGKNRHDSIPLSTKHILSYILSYHGFVCCVAINLANHFSYYSLNIGLPSVLAHVQHLQGHQKVVILQAYINNTRPSQALYHISESFSKAWQAKLIST